MLTKLRISNEQILLEELGGASEDFFIESYTFLCGSLSIKNTIPLTIPSTIIDLYELSFNGVDKKTNTYYYDFIKKDF
jgi:hypothetical protein